MNNQAKSKTVKSSTESTEMEINRLRAQVHDLQAELSRRNRGLNNIDEYEDNRYSTQRSRNLQNSLSEDDEEYFPNRGQYDQAIDEAADIVNDLPLRVMDEASKFVRGLTFAYLEQLRYTGDVVNTFVDEVITRNQPRRRSGNEDRRFEARLSTSRRTRSGDDRDGSYSLEYASESDEDNRDDRPYRSRNRYAGQQRQRRRSDGSRRTMTGLATDLPIDIYSGFVRALDHSLNIPSAAVESFNDTYRETEEEAESSLTRSRRRRDSPISERRQDFRTNREEEDTTDNSESGSSTQFEAGVNISKDTSDS